MPVSDTEDAWADIQSGTNNRQSQGMVTHNRMQQWRTSPPPFHFLQVRAREGGDSNVQVLWRSKSAAWLHMKFIYWELWLVTFARIRICVTGPSHAIRLLLTRSDECWIQGLYPIGGHDNFHVSARVKAVKLVEQLQHGPLDLPLASRVGVVPAQHSHDETFMESTELALVFWLHRHGACPSCGLVITDFLNWVYSMWATSSSIIKVSQYPTTNMDRLIRLHQPIFCLTTLVGWIIQVYFAV